MRKVFGKVNEWAWPLVILFVGLVLAIRGIGNGFPDSDTFFIIETGRYIVENGEVPTINPFVIHEGFEIIVQQWLFDVLIYSIYNAGGWIGVFFYSMAILAVSSVIMYHFFGLYNQNKKLKIVLLSICIAVGSSFFVARPTSLSFLMCISVVAVMEAYQRKNVQWVLFLLPLISLATINIHAAMWPMLFVLMMPFIFPDSLPNIHEFGVSRGLAIYVKEWFVKWKWVLLAMLGMVMAGFVNPNGLNGISYLILSYGTANGASITELQAPAMLSYFGVFVLGAFALLILYVYKHKRNTNIKNLCMAAGTLLMAMLHLRNVWFLFFGAVPLFFEMLDGAEFMQKGNRRTTAVSLIAKFYGVCLVVILAFGLCGSISFDVEDDALSPTKAVEYLDTLNKDDIVLYTGFNNGAYMELNGYKVYMDARPELFQKKINKKEDVCTEFLNVLSGNCDYPAFFEKYKFTHMIVEDGSVLSGFMRSYDGYKQVVVGEGYVLYERVPTP